MNYFNYYQPQPQSSLTWVSGIEGARSFYVAPGSTVALWDSESQTIYLKSADASGMPTMKILDYALRGAQAAQDGVADTKVEYLTKDDLEAVLAQISDLREEIDSLSIRRAPKKKEAEE